MSVTDNPEGTNQAQVIVPETPEGEKVSSEQPKYTQEQLDMAAHQALSAAGRTAKALEKREEAIRSAEERVAQAVKDKDEKEEEAARDDPEELKKIRAGHSLREAKAKLAKVERELEEERTKGKQRDEEAVQTNREILTFGIATKHNVDAETLKNLSKHTDGSTEAIEALALALPKKGEAKPPLIGDSGRTIGGSGNLTAAMVEKMTPEERWQRRDEIAKMPLRYTSLA